MRTNDSSRDAAGAAGEPAARTRDSRGVVLSLVATAVLVAVVVRLALTGALFGVGPISIALQAAAALVMVWARMVFGVRSFHAGANPTRGPLVTRGPFSVVRNPIYASMLTFVAVGVAVHFTWTRLALLVVAIAAALVRIFAEERELRATYDEYGDYVRRVKRLVPFVY